MVRATRGRNYEQHLDQSNSSNVASEGMSESAPSDQGHVQEIQEQVRNADLPRDASKLPTFRGDDKDVRFVQPCPNASDRYFVANSAAFAVDPNDQRKLATIGNCFPNSSDANTWYDEVWKSFLSYDELVDAFIAIENYEAGEENLVRLQQSWEQATQGKHTARDFHRYLIRLRMRISAVDAEEKPFDSAFLRKFCANLREPTRTVIAKRRISELNLTLPQLVKLAEIEEKSMKHRPNLNSFDTSRSTPSSSGTSSAPPTNSGTPPNNVGTPTKRYCWYCKSHTHSIEKCRRVTARRAAGTWKENLGQQGPK
jgi:hypothetical protein